jgi:hypothetical protein
MVVSDDDHERFLRDLVVTARRILGTMSRSMFAKTIRHGCDVRLKKLATTWEGAARSVLGTVNDKKLPEMCRRQG